MHLAKAIRYAALSLVLIFGAFISALPAALLVYEPFDYLPQTSVNGLPADGLNLTGSYSTATVQDLVVSSPGLNYGSLQGHIPGVTGNRLTDENGIGSGVVRVSLASPVEILPGHEIYFSALFTFDDSVSGNRFARIYLVDDDSGDELGFGQAVVGLRGVQVTANSSATGRLVSDGADNSFVDRDSLWLIGRYFNSPAPNADVLELIGYNTALPHVVPSAFNISDPNAQFAFSLKNLNVDITQITSMRLEIRGDNNNFIDEVRIGSSYAAITAPEPESLVGAAVVLAISLICRRTQT